MPDDVTVKVECSDLISEVLVMRSDHGISEVEVVENGCSATVTLVRPAEQVWEEEEKSWESA